MNRPDPIALKDMPQEVRLADYAPPDWLVPEVALDFDLATESTRVVSRLSVRRNGGHDRPLRLDGHALKTLSVKIDGVPVNAAPEGDQLVLTIPGDTAEVEIEVEIVPAANTRLMGLYASEGRLVTQCEAEGFRAITWFPDRPDVLSTYRVRMVADAARYPVLLSNGDRGAAETLPDGRHAVTWTDP